MRTSHPTGSDRAVSASAVIRGGVGCVLAVLMAAPVVSARTPLPGRRPYLPAVGSAPLRVLAAAPSTTRVAFAPLAPEPPVTTGSPESDSAGGSGPGKDPAAAPGAGPAPAVGPVLVSTADPTATSGGPGVGLPAVPGGPEAGSGLLVDPAVSAVAPTVITPQMLVQFFRPTGSNLLGGAWSVPVFVPPTAPPAAVRPSSATYRSQ